MKYITVIFLFSVFCFSCISKEKNSEVIVEEIKIYLHKEYTEKKFPNTNYSMTIQRLEDNEDFPVGQVDKLIVDKNRIYILDRSKAGALFVYSREGKLLHIINAKGNAPGEFVMPQDFEVEKKTGNILIMDTSGRKIIYYSPLGKYIKEIKYDTMAVGFVLSDDGNIIMDNGNIPSDDRYYYLKKINQKGKLLSTYFAADTSTIGITFNPRLAFQTLNDKLYYLPTLSNTIYLLEKDNPVPIYQLDFGKDWPSVEFCESVKKLHPLQIRERMFEQKYVCFFNYLQTKDVLHVDFYYKEKNYSFYYNKNTKQSLLIPMEDESLSLPIATYDNEFIFIKYNEITGEPTIVFYTVNFDI